MGAGAMSSDEQAKAKGELSSRHSSTRGRGAPANAETLPPHSNDNEIQLR
jgi:hypothetical protein